MNVKMATALVLLVVIGVSTADESLVWRFNRCPQPCDCGVRFSARFSAHLRTVNCTGRQLVAFPPPEHVPSDVQVLLLSDNHIERVHRLRMWFPDLLQLDLSHNLVSQLSSADGAAFEGAYNLRLLDLSHNLLNTLRGGAFDGLFDLTELNLSFNRLSAIMQDAFRGLSKLETLHLSANRITYIQHSWWRDISSLYNLYLDRNLLSLVQADCFKPLRHLLNLDLSRNRIFRVNRHALAGLASVENVQLAGNALSAVPRQALKAIGATLSSINLSRNPIFQLSTDDLAQLAHLKDVSLTSMQRLRVVERGSFKNLPQLLVVQLHDNPYLSYVDEAAFVNAPQVTHLLLHNNNLSVFERDTVASLPALEHVSFYGNPLACDCNARWFKALLSSADSRIRFQEAERMVCSSPAEHKFKLFATLRPEDMPYHCPPRILHLFDGQNTRKLGDGIVYECRAVGQPKPRVTWIAPDGRAVSPAAYHPRRLLRNGRSLVLRRVTPADSGLYTCIAESDSGSAAAQTRLNVTDMRLQLVPLDVGATSVTVGWQGADHGSHVFQLVYRLASSDERHRYVGTVTPIMSSYKVTNLRANSRYEFCLAIEDGEDVSTHVSCALVHTRRADLLVQAVERTNNVAVGAALALAACLLIVACLAALGCRRGHGGVAHVRPFDDWDELERGGCQPAPGSPFLPSPSSPPALYFHSTENVYSPLVPSDMVEKRPSRT